MLSASFGPKCRFGFGSGFEPAIRIRNDSESYGVPSGQPREENASGLIRSRTQIQIGVQIQTDICTSGEAVKDVVCHLSNSAGKCSRPHSGPHADGDSYPDPEWL
jgi:hypothetical protein